MSFFYEAIKGQLRTVYEVFAVFTVRDSSDSTDTASLETIQIDGRPIPILTGQGPYTLRPRKPVKYSS